jgi:hypothetical protein
VLPADEDIFRLREEERRRQQAMRETAQSSRVHEKSTFSSRMQATFSSSSTEAKNPFKELLTKPRATGELTLAEAAAPPERRLEKENIAEFIAKKREIFLVQVPPVSSP